MAVVVRQAILRNQFINLTENTLTVDKGMGLMREESLKRIQQEAEAEEVSRHSTIRPAVQSKRGEKEENSIVFKKLKRVVKLKKRLKFNDSFAAFLSISGVILSFIELEDTYLDTGSKSRYEASNLGIFLRVLVSCTTATLLFMIYRHYNFEYEVAREKEFTGEVVGDYFTQSVFFKYMLVEGLVCAVHPLPGVDTTFTFDQLNGSLVINLGSILSCLMLLRFYIVIRIATMYSKWTSIKADNICSYFECEASTIFVLRCFIKEKPYRSLCILMGLTITILGFATRTFERPYNLFNGQEQDYDYVWNSMWLIVLTMTTVGYGDFYPRTHMGRVIVSIGCFWGIFLVSMMVITLTESSEFSKGEMRAYDLLCRLNTKEKSKKLAARVVWDSLKLWKLKKKNIDTPEHAKLIHDKYSELKFQAREFAGISKKLKTWELSVEELLKQFTEKIDVEMENLKSQIASVIEIDHQLQRIESFQDQSLEASYSSVTYMKELQNKLDKYIASMQLVTEDID